MTAKEYLSQAYMIDQRINAKLEQVMSLRHTASRATNMAKDGTNRGGRRVRAGDKPTPLADKITAGKAAKVLEAPDLKPETALTGTLLPSPAVLTDTDMPEPSEYLRANQKDGKPLGADTLFIETWRWLKERAYEL